MFWLMRREPWEGQSPRALTRGRLGVILKTRGGRARVKMPVREQVDELPRRRERVSNKSRTAPLLLPLPW